MHYLICGFSGSGKSYRLQQLALDEQFRHYNFIDLDEYIAIKYGYSKNEFPAVIKEKGWDWFRSVEKKELRSLIAQPHASWIALGGGTLDEEFSKEILLNTSVKCFWLNVGFETCWERIKGDLSRPLVQMGKEKMQELYLKRQNIYCKFDRLDF